ncbi:AbrB family transcriptional regulator [Geobacillus stearothermophilus]|uniref:AbrB/MazE/SpoVT family DNA-binding domain-containing protein n=1 Tax=Geobacillus stearothermophilus TaxID=1422 RepID=UPI003D1A1136
MAKTTGVLRGFDKAGRFVIPAEMVRTLELGVDDLLEISCDGTTIYLRKHQPFCIFCGEQDEKLISFKNKNICQSCAAEITSVVQSSLKVEEKIK